jgi:carbamoyl-phosphate synthase small subunit
LKANLILEDGTNIEGVSFGYEKSISGELVFNTSMVGYIESLTDPSYYKQILVLTYPNIGNYGVPNNNKKENIEEFFESDKIQISALIVNNYSEKYNHWNSEKSLSEWLIDNKIPALTGIDTRKLTKIIREKGTMKAKIIFNNENIDFIDINEYNLIKDVSIKEKTIYGNGKYKILLLDCGVKNNIIRNLLKFDTQIIRVPWDYDFSNVEFDGLFISNGPGDPKKYDLIINKLKLFLNKNIPIFGICLGHQLLSLASGSDTYKLKFGHRSHNQPVLDIINNKSYLTSQNHSFCVKNSTINDEWNIYFKNLNDNSNEGIIHKTKPFFTTQFHPEGWGGPDDTSFLFENFIDNIKKYKKE